MTTAYTTLLGLALPVQGELQGTWGDEVNNYITNYLDAAVAGTQTISGSQTAVTLSKTTGSSLSQAGSGATGSSQYFVINCTGNPAGTLTITAPAASKAYLIINATSTSQDVKIVGAGPTTGVTLVSGERAIVSWNGSDFVKVANFGGVGSFTTISATTGNITTVNATTVDTTNLEVTNIKAKDGTASMTLADSTGVASFSANPVFSGGTANGVLYLNGSKVATSGSALTFDGNNLGVGSAAGSNARLFAYANDATLPTLLARQDGAGPMQVWQSAGGAEQMRLTSTGLGIGTSSPTRKLDLNGTSTLCGITSTGASGYSQLDFVANARSYQIGVGGGSTGSPYANNLYFVDSTASAVRMVLDSSGNLGLGVTPSAVSTSDRVLQVRNFLFDDNINGYGILRYNNYYNGTNDVYLNTGAVSAFQMQGNAFKWYQAASGTAGNAISFTQAMTLDASGNLGVGTTSPTSGFRLDVQAADAKQRIESTTGTNSVQQRFVNTGGTFYAGIDNSSGAVFGAAYSAVLWHSGNYPMLFGTNNTERARITSGGDLLVGTTSALKSGKVSVNASGTNGITCQVDDVINPAFQAWSATTAGNALFIDFITEGGAGTARGSISYNRAGGLVAYNTTSDYRAKDIIGPVQNVGATIDALKVYEGVMKGATQSRPMLIAHEAQAHAPYAVSGVKDEVNEDGTPKFQQMDVSSLVPLLLAEIQSLRARVAALEAQP